ncbi:ABC transporter substrate-binding protein [Shinella pollutisoli]|uniref:PotD/PotF family extracellular solute-binding protein n=1 Tax=Shinella pollutisoli TaxID=2250594 RepID=A0ABV7DHY3_9HYPH|nr:spermidine/putrescine ABC transporter substrate-binding protein [Shinella pollutisoli]
MDRKELSVWVEKYRRGHISRRGFLTVTGIGATMLGMGIRPSRALSQELSGTVTLATWPSYQNQANLDSFTEKTGVSVNMAIFGSNEEMMAKMQAGESGFDIIAPSQYAIPLYASGQFIEPLDLSLLPNYDAAAVEPRFVEQGTFDGKTYAVQKNWGTSGFIINTTMVTTPFTSVKDYFDGIRGPYSGYGVALDHPLDTVGFALKYHGYSFNSVDEAELKKAEELLLETKPHLYAVTTDFQPMMSSGDASIAMGWSFNAMQLHRDMPEIQYVIAKEGGEIWCDFYVITRNGPNRAAAYALVNHLLDPANNVLEFEAHGSAISDTRVLALLPPEVQTDPILYPAKELLDPLEFGIAEAMSNPLRNEIMARFKSA